MTRGTALVLAAVLGLCACSSDHRPEAVPDETGLGGPGTALGEGFEVPDGAQLLGGVYPGGGTYNDDEPEESWTAELLVEGDPREVHEAFKHQALAAGLQLGAGCDAGEEETVCQIAAHVDEEGFLRTGFSVFIEQTTAASPEWASHATVGFVRWAPGVVPADRFEFAGLEPLAAVPGPGDAPTIPDVGDPVADERSQATYGRLPLIVVADGSEVVAPVRTLTCATGGFTAHLLLTDEAVADYRAQMDEWDWDDGDGPVEGEFRGHDTLHDARYTSGGGDLTLDVIYGNGDEPTVARLSRCND